jgi:hypothetical protein
MFMCLQMMQESISLFMFLLQMKNSEEGLKAAD